MCKTTTATTIHVIKYEKLSCEKNACPTAQLFDAVFDLYFVGGARFLPAWPWMPGPALCVRTPVSGARPGVDKQNTYEKHWDSLFLIPHSRSLQFSDSSDLALSYSMIL